MGWRGIESSATTKVVTEPLLMFYGRDRCFLEDRGAIGRQAGQGRQNIEARLGAEEGE